LRTPSKKQKELLPAYPIISDIFREILRTIWIEIIRKYSAALFGSWDCERTYTSKHIRNDLFWLEQMNQPIMLCMQPRVPVNLCEVKSKATVGFVLA